MRMRTISTKKSVRVVAAMGVLAAALLLVGCFPISLQPFYAEKDLIFDQSLVGAWVDKKENGAWAFRKSDDKSYKLTITGTSGAFEARLFKLGKTLFIDLCPNPAEVVERPSTNKNELASLEQDSSDLFYGLHFVTAHSVVRVRIEDKKLRLALLNEEWLEALADRKKLGIPYQIVDDRIVLTASTKQLRQFLLQYGEDPKAFEDPTTLERQAAK